MRLQLGRVQGGGRYETKHRCHDGSLLDVEVSVGVMEAGAGDSMVLIRDVSQRRRETVVAARRPASARVPRRPVQAVRELRRVRDRASRDRPGRATRPAARSRTCISSIRRARRSRSQPGAIAASRMATMVDAEPRPLARAGLFTECVRARHATSSNDLTRKPQQDGLPDLQRYLAVPMIADDETVAVLGVANREAGYGEDDQRACRRSADGVWRVLQTKRAHAATLGSLQRTDVAMQGMIDSMVRMSERHDPYTAGSVAPPRCAGGRARTRSRARRRTSARAARRGAAARHRQHRRAARRFLPSRRRSRRPSIAIMRTHVDEGCQLLAEIDFGAPIADIVYQSHERYDGSGYPRGLKGEEILRRSAHPRDRRHGRSDVLAASVSARGRHGSGHRRRSIAAPADSTTCTSSRPARGWCVSTASRCRNERMRDARHAFQALTFFPRQRPP